VLGVEAYWTLGARATANQTAGARRALTAAYERHTTADRRAAYDREHGYLRDEPPVDEKKHKKDRKNGAKQASDHYQLLAVGREADPDVIEVAYRIAMRKASGYHPELVLQREQLTDAYHTLSNAQLRAQYDATIGGASMPAGQVVPPPAPATKAAAEDVPDFLSSKNSPRGDSADKKRGVFGLFGRQKKPTSRPAAPARPSDAGVHSKLAEEAARGERLLELRPFGAEVLVGSMRAAPVAEQPPMAVLSVAGPQGEERVPLPPRTITIGSSDENDIILPGRRVAPEQARLWPHGDSFALRVTGRGTVRVGGVEPTLAVVLLEDGDLIELSEYRLTFHNAPRR
jgi:hypothetical protein